MVSITDANGLITRTSYDRYSLRPGVISFPATPTRAFVPITSYRYDDAAMTVKEQAMVRGETEFDPPIVASEAITTYNGLGIPREIRSRAGDGGWDVVTLQYDELGRLKAQSLPYRESGNPPNWIENSYDALGRPKTIKTPGNSITEFFYNEANRPDGATQDAGQTLRQVDPVGRERWMFSDALGRIREVAEPDPSGAGSVFLGTPLMTSYSYGAQSMRVKQGVQESRFHYDSLGRLTHQALPGRDAVLNGPDTKKWSDVFTYDQWSHVIRHDDARGYSLRYIYGNDPLQRLQRIEATGSGDNTVDNTVYEYMTSGDLMRPRKITTAGVVEEAYDYDNEGRLVALKRTLSDRPNFPLEIGYGYDLFGRLSEQRYPAQFGVAGQPRKLVGYAYGLDSRPNIVKVDGVPVASDIVYNAGGQIVSMMLGSPNGPRRTQESYRYFANGLPENLAITRTGQDLAWTHYDYTKAGQLVLQLDSSDANVRGYTYDALGRLKTADSPRGVVYPGWHQTYSYDRYGNRISTQATGGASTDTPIPTDGSAQLSFEEKTGRITTPGYEYDAAGNLTRAPRRGGLLQIDYDYDEAGRLVRALAPTACFRCAGAATRPMEVYRYGADRRRIITDHLTVVENQSPAPPELNGRTYDVWNGDQTIAEYSEAVTANAPSTPRWTRSYLYLGSRLLATFEPGAAGEEVRYYHPDRLGTTRLITDPAKDATVNQFVLPYGTVLEGAASGRRFTSYDRSATTGLDYAVNRFYDPVSGRFTQGDPLGIAAANPDDPQSLNMYAYVQNDPVNATDSLALRESSKIPAVFWPAIRGVLEAAFRGGDHGGAEPSRPSRLQSEWYGVGRTADSGVGYVGGCRCW